MIALRSTNSNVDSESNENDVGREMQPVLEMKKKTGKFQPKKSNQMDWITVLIINHFEYTLCNWQHNKCNIRVSNAHRYLLSLKLISNENSMDSKPSI